MIRFPYGMSNFHRIRTDNYLYIDRTNYLPLLEEVGRQLVFLRPRRFGKSLLLSMLSNYYDMNKADQFESLFGDLTIGANPTPEHNQYLILQWDFSMVSGQGNIEQIKKNLFDHVNSSIRDFLVYYADRLTGQPIISSTNALLSLEELTAVVRHSGQSIYLFIDEYDNFANEVLMHDIADKKRYLDLLEGEGIVKSLFKIIKGSATEGGIERVFITGVAPLVLSDVTSGYNVATSIFMEDEFNALCGVTNDELTQLVTQVTEECGQSPKECDSLLATMKDFYNGYRFCQNTDQETLYNPTLCFYFLRHYQKKCETPRQMLDANLATDAGRIRYIAQLPEGTKVLEQIMDAENPPTLPLLENQFGIEHLERLQHDSRYMISLMYFFGILTIKDIVGLGNLQMGVPNLVIQALYVKQLLNHALPKSRDQILPAQLAEKFYQSADLKPLADYMEEKYFTVFNNRDYRWSNELTVKTAFLTLLFNDLWYVMDSERVVKRQYSDLVMTIRPSMRKYETLKDIIVEFKYLSLQDLGLTGEQLREQSRETLMQLAIVQEKLDEAEKQLNTYRITFNERIQEPKRLVCIVVVSLGFDRVVWRNV